VYLLDKTHLKWVLLEDVVPAEDFLFFSSTVYLPKGYGIFLIGGLDNQDNYSRKCLWLKKYRNFYEKCPMLQKRAFFSALFCRVDSQVYVFGGFDGQKDLASCEKYSLYENVWREIKPMSTPKNGAASLHIKRTKCIYVFGGNN